MPGIVVVTRDGRPPSQGGVRLRYEADGSYVTVGRTELVPLAPPKPATPLLDAYQALPEATGPSWNRACGHCGSYATYDTFCNTEHGLHSVCGCRRCGKDSRLP